MAAETTKQLLVAEILGEQSRRAVWEAALVQWRTLRTHHSISLFCQRLQSWEFAEPPARLLLFSRLRDAEAAAYQQLKSHCNRVAGMGPPNMSIAGVRAWVEGLRGLEERWEAARAAWVAEYEQQEGELEQQVGWLVDHRV